MVARPELIIMGRPGSHAEMAYQVLPAMLLTQIAEPTWANGEFGNRLLWPAAKE